MGILWSRLNPAVKGRSSVVGMGGDQGGFLFFTILAFLSLGVLPPGIDARSGTRLPSPIRLESLPTKTNALFVLPASCELW